MLRISKVILALSIFLVSHAFAASDGPTFSGDQPIKVIFSHVVTEDPGLDLTTFSLSSVTTNCQTQLTAEMLSFESIAEHFRSHFSNVLFAGLGTGSLRYGSFVMEISFVDGALKFDSPQGVDLQYFARRLKAPSETPLVEAMVAKLQEKSDDKLLLSVSIRRGYPELGSLVVDYLSQSTTTTENAMNATPPGPGTAVVPYMQFTDPNRDEPEIFRRSFHVGEEVLFNGTLWTIVAVQEGSYYTINNGWGSQTLAFRDDLKLPPHTGL